MGPRSLFSHLASEIKEMHNVWVCYSVCFFIIELAVSIISYFCSNNTLQTYFHSFLKFSIIFLQNTNITSLIFWEEKSSTAVKNFKKLKYGILSKNSSVRGDVGDWRITGREAMQKVNKLCPNFLKKYSHTVKVQ